MKSFLDQTPAPPGWFVYYHHQAENEIRLPVALWVLVEDDETETAEFRPYVVGRLGQVIDFADYQAPVLCILPPGVDHRELMLGFLPENQRVTVTCPDLKLN